MDEGRVDARAGGDAADRPALEPPLGEDLPSGLGDLLARPRIARPGGDLQAWLVGRILGDESATAAALDRLERAAFADGMLPEAVVRDGTGTIPIRHWFAWPGAALATFWLLDRRGALDVLRAAA